MIRIIITIACLTPLVACWHEAFAEGSGQGARVTAVLRLRGGDHARGSLVGDENASVLKWQSPSFDRPFVFPISSVDAISYPLPAEVSAAIGQFGFDLVNGDRLYGSLAGLRDDRWLVETAPFGTVALEGTAVRRVFRWRDGRELIYDGLRPLQNWRSVSPAAGWRFNDGVLSTDQPMAQLRGDLQLPAQARIDLHISWTKHPNFVVALGVDPDVADGAGGARLEVWDEDLVILQERPDRAAVASIAKVPDGPGEIRLSVILDQTVGRTVVLSESGSTIADIYLPQSAGEPRSGVRLQNIRGDLRLESLRVTRGYPAAASDGDAAGGRLRLIDGFVVRGRVVGIDAVQRRLEVQTAGTEGTLMLDADKIAEILFPLVDPPAGADRQGRGRSSLAASVLRVRVTTHDGMRLSGILLAIGQQRLQLHAEGFDEPTVVQTKQLRSLAVLPSIAAEGAGATGDAGTTGFGTAAPVDGSADPVPAAAAWLQLSDARLHGRLIDSRRPDSRTAVGGTSLVWLPRGSSSPAALLPDVHGEIVFGAATAEVSPDEASHRPPGSPPPFTLGKSGDGPTGGRSMLYLRSGDQLPCRIQRVTERGIAIRGARSQDVTWVAHQDVQAVELNAPYKSLQLEAERRRRLLTVPRRQRHAPPTHLIASTEGDWLRGRSLALDDQRVTIQTPYGPIQVPRGHVAVIVWIGDSETPDPGTDGQPAAGDAAAGDDGFRVQAIRADGSRLTFSPSEVTSGVLSGNSAVLGPCSVSLSTLDRLLLGDAVDAAAALPEYQGWTLVPAADVGGSASATRLPRVGRITAPGDRPADSDD